MEMSFIGALNTLFWICLAFAVLFFIISVVLFFVFDIRSVFNIKTGRAKAKTIKEMTEANESSGRLRVGGKTQTSKLSSGDIKHPREVKVTPPSQEFLDRNYNIDGAATTAEQGAETGDPREPAADVSGTDETEILDGNRTETLRADDSQASDGNETQVLGTNETQALGANETQTLGTNETQALGANETQELSEQDSAPQQRTKELNNVRETVRGETRVLSNDEYGKTEKLTKPEPEGAVTEKLVKKPAVGFKVVKKDVFTHTDEMI